MSRTRGTRRPILLGSIPGQRFDYYVGPSGSDTADGSVHSPFQTIGKLVRTINALPTNARRTARVLAGSYTDSGLYFAPSNTGIRIGLQVDQNVSINTSASGTRLDGIGAEGSGTVLDAVIYGTSFTGNAVSSCNGVSAAGSATIRIIDPTGVFDVDSGTWSGGSTFTGYDDGCSGHNTSVGYVQGCKFTNGAKSAYAHVNSASFTHVLCVFEGKSGASGGIGVISQTPDTSAGVFDRCWFVPGSAGQLTNLGNSLITRCVVGTTTVAVQLNNTAATGTFRHCYLNAYIDGNAFIVLDHCYGKVATRMRSGGNIQINHGVFLGPATGFTSGLVHRTFDSSGARTLTIVNTVATGYSTAIGQGVGTTDAGYFLSSANSATYMGFHSNTTNVDADLISAGCDVSTGNVSGDPLLSGGGTGYRQSNYAVTAAGLLGTGSGGTNIGFRLTDI